MTSGCAKCSGDDASLPAIDMAFQPIFDLRTNSVYAYEALVRGPEGQPAPYIMEQLNDENCHKFDQQVRIVAVRKAVSLGLLDTDAKLSINFMPRAVIEAKRCLRHIIEVAEEVGLPHHRVIFEFTEDERVEKKKAQRISSVYRDLGFLTALDDFGAGFCGLVTLADIPSDIVKIDIGLIHNIDQDIQRYRIVEGVVAMLRGIGRTVVVEGVETPGEMAAVSKLGVDLVQGYFLGRPSMSQLLAQPSLAA